MYLFVSIFSPWLRSILKMFFILRLFANILILRTRRKRKFKRRGFTRANFLKTLIPIAIIFQINHALPICFLWDGKRRMQKKKKCFFDIFTIQRIVSLRKSIIAGLQRLDESLIIAGFIVITKHRSKRGEPWFTLKSTIFLRRKWSQQIKTCAMLIWAQILK